MELKNSSIKYRRIIFFSIFIGMFFISGFTYVFISGFTITKFFIFLFILVVLIIVGIIIPVVKNTKLNKNILMVNEAFDKKSKNKEGVYDNGRSKSTQFVRVCSSCGNIIGSNDVYCSECGITIN